MHEGTLIDYRRRVHGVPVRWRTRINVGQPPHRFVAEQIRSPCRQWIHERTFEARAGGGPEIFKPVMPRPISGCSIR